MDRRVFRMAMLTILSGFLLVLVIVYATNAEKINKLFGSNKSNTVNEAVSEETATYYSSDVADFAQQIGDNLDGFLLDQDFFDETEKVPSVVVIKKSGTSSEESVVASTSSSSVEENGTGMAVVGELLNPSGEGLDPSTLDSSLFQYNGQMPGAPQEGTAGAGTPVGTTP